MKNNHDKILKSLPLWKNSDILLEKLDGGRSNFNYLVMADGKKYVAHFALKNNILLGLDREREVFNTKIVASLNIGPEVVGFFPEHNLLILGYIEGQVLPDRTRLNSNQIKLISKLLKKMHDGPKFSGQFNVFERIKKDVAAAEDRQGWLPDDIESLMAKLEILELKLKDYQKICPCHCDLVINNLVWQDDGLKIIDWEYSANSSPLYDLAMLSSRANFNKEDMNLFLREYSNENLYKFVKLMETAVCLREAAWAFFQMVISENKDVDYKKYAEENLKQFKELSGKII